MKKRDLLFMIFGLLIVALAFGINRVSARNTNATAPTISPLHPTFAMLDANGKNVLESGGPVSTMQTCGQCHDTKFIQGHAFHSDLGLADYKTSTKTWDASTGIFGKWDPLTYRYLSEKGDERLDLSTAEWLMLNGEHIIGGGPADTARDGQKLTSLKPNVKNPEASILNIATGKPEGWDWSRSGTMEMDCFVCHLEKPNNEARLKAIQTGQFGLANTATLFDTGIASGTGGGGFEWNTDAFDETGKLNEEYVLIQDPTNANCAACHGEVHPETSEPLTLKACDLNYPQTATTGQVIAGQKISNSGVNLSGKDELNRSWDIHAERELKCTDCHYALNNPARARDTQSSNPKHLIYDPRTLDIGEYLQRPDHNFARGQSAQFNVASDQKGTMRRCDSCHDANVGHADWLPYIDKHMSAVACETCHIPQMYAPAIQSNDWTVITTDGKSIQSCRGVEGDPKSDASLVTGFKPVLLNRTNIDGNKLLAPYNLITSFYWVYDDANGNKRPVRLADLEAAYLQNAAYAPDILTAFDSNVDGKLTNNEIVLDTTTKQDAVKTRLSALGLNNPRIEGMVQPYSINHDVARSTYAINDCTVCHNDQSRVSQSIKLADKAPAGIMPVFVNDTNVDATGEIVTGGDGALYYQPKPANDKMYIFGSSSIKWIDWFGGLLFVGVLVGVSGHGTLRYFSGRKQAKVQKRTERVYIYQSYERFWHWLQTVVIVVLLFTGLIIHRPDMFGAFSFRGVVIVHNVLAAILAINAFLSLFYHLTTGEIRQFIPRPYGFFDDAIEQALYYLKGIFKGEAHPFAKTADSKMNPLQQVTYFGILNVLLPLQGITGILMWGVQRWPALANMLGGLPFLAPLHTLIAWTFASFIVGHVYLTTTGATPLEAIRGMVTGYEEVEMHEEKAEKK
jgi:thiosulfate reductase cytochrome b subunit